MGGTYKIRIRGKEIKRSGRKKGSKPKYDKLLPNFALKSYYELRL